MMYISVSVLRAVTYMSASHNSSSSVLENDRGDDSVTLVPKILIVKTNASEWELKRWQTLPNIDGLESLTILDVSFWDRV